MSDASQKPDLLQRIMKSAPAQQIARAFHDLGRNPVAAFGVVIITAGMLIFGIFTIGPNGYPEPPLYKLYPDSTSFYLQFAPGEKLARRLLVSLDTRARNNALPTVGARGEGDVFFANLMDKFGTTFESHFSVGVWPAADNFKNSQLLLAFPLREQFTLDDLAQRFGWQGDDFARANYNNTPVLIDKDSGVTLAVVDTYFLLANSKEAMQAVLTFIASKKPNVFDHPVNKKYLRKLPGKRDGTLIINNTVYADHAMANRQYLPSQVFNKMEKFAKILPVTIAALSVDTDDPNTEKEKTYLRVETITPLVLKGFENKDFQKDLRKIYSQTVSFKTPASMPEDTSFFLAWAGFDNFIDLYIKHLATPAEKFTLKMVEDRLKDQKLDLRKDVIGLLDDEAAVMVPVADESGHSRMPVLLFSKTGQKEKNLARLSALLVSSIGPVEQKDDQFEAVKAHTITAKGKDLHISYGAIGPVIGLAATPDFATLVKVKSNEVESLGNSVLYKRMSRTMPDRANGRFFVRIKPSMENAISRWVRIATGAIWAKKGNDGDLVFGKFTLQLTDDPADVKETEAKQKN